MDQNSKSKVKITKEKENSKKEKEPISKVKIKHAKIFPKITEGAKNLTGDGQSKKQTIEVYPEHGWKIKTVKVKSGWFIDSITFIFKNVNSGETFSAGPYGGTGGQDN